MTVSSLVVKIFPGCFKGLTYKGWGVSPAPPQDEQRELSGIDLFKAVRERVRDLAQNQGEEKPKKSL